MVEPFDEARARYHLKLLRTQGLLRALPIAVVTAGAVAIAWRLAGQVTELTVGVTVTVSIAITLAGVAAAMKIRRDGAEKVRQRETIDALEQELLATRTQLDAERSERHRLEGRIHELSGSHGQDSGQPTTMEES